MIVASWNVNSISVRLPQVLDWITANEPDILCLQETKVVDERFPKAEFEELGYQLAVYGEKTYNGVAIASKLPLANVQKGFKVEVGPGSRRLIAADAGPLRILNVYIPNGSAVGSDKYYYKLAWLSALKNHIDESYRRDDLLIMCGDFNIACEDRDIYNPEEVAGTIMCSDVERKALNAVKDWGLIDVFREHHQDSGLYTWWDYRMGAFRRNVGFRIDHIWASRPLAPLCKAILIDREPRKLERPSDHAPVFAEFDVTIAS